MPGFSRAGHFHWGLIAAGQIEPRRRSQEYFVTTFFDSMQNLSAWQAIVRNLRDWRRQNLRGALQ
jgi:hypothetical protein